MTVPGFYFDGRTSRRFGVTLRLDGGTFVLSGDVERRYPVEAVKLSEASRSAPRKLSFPDGACLEVLDNRALQRLLEACGRREPLAVRICQSWRATGAALIAIIVLLVAGYRYGLPVLAAQLADAIPASVEKRLGDDALALLDRNLFAPSELPPERRDAILRRFAALRLPEPAGPNTELLFRKSRGGPNAFTLPARRIVLTDGLLERIPNDEALTAVIAHELGHVAGRHLLRRMVRTAVTGAAMTLLFGDLSALAANLPTVMLDLKYSRDSEREADDYAVRMLRLNGMNPQALASALRALDAMPAAASSVPDYLSSHPGIDERIARLPSR